MQSNKAYNNVLYASQINSSATMASADSGKNVAVSILAPYSVVLVDGVTSPTIPIMAELTSAGNKDRVVSALYPTQKGDWVANDSLKLQSLWHPNASISAKTIDLGWALSQPSENGAGFDSNTCAWDRSETTANFRNQTIYIANICAIEPATSFDESGYKVYGNGIDWRCMYGASVGDTDYTFTGNNDMIYCIDYATTRQVLDTNKSKILAYCSNISDYSDGSISAIFENLEAVLNIDPNTYNYSDNLVLQTEQCVADIKTATQNLNNVLNS